jgi:cytochrome c-type biogenesis protein CcmH
VCCLFLIISQKNLLAETSNSNKNFIINKTREISQNIKCLVCQNQSIDESNSEIAKDLKVLIKDKLKDGVTDEEIYKFLRDRYGDTILLKPPLETNTILLWFLPFIILVFGSFFVIRFFKSNYK